MGARVNEVRGLVQHYDWVLRECGLLGDGERIACEEGSPTYGRAWRVFVTGGKYGSGYHEPPDGHYHIGWSKSEAAHNLTVRTSAMLAVLRRFNQER